MPSHQLQRSTEPSAPELRSRVTNAAVVYAIVFTERRHGGQDGFGLLKGKQTLFFFHAPLAYMERTGSFAGPVLVPGRPEDCCLADAIRRLLCCLLCIPSQRSGVETEAKPFQCARPPEQK